MLGWFKKKFRKKEEKPVIENTLDSVQEEKVEAIDVATPEPPSPPTPNTDITDSTPATDSDPATNETKETEQAVVSPELDDDLVSESVGETAEYEDLPQQQEATKTVDVTEDSNPDVADEPLIQKADEVKTEQDQKENKKDSLFSRLSNRLGKTKESFTYQMDALFLGKKEIDGELLDDLEEILITADLGVETAEELIDNARKKVKRKKLSDPNALKDILKEQIKQYIMASDADATLVMPESGPFVIMVIGVNGVGKTTTIGKVANKFKKSGHSVMLVAADTFRAAAVSQLKIWGERNDVPVISQHEGADPSAVVFDALSSALATDVDVVIVDTAGRMHTKDNLMEELKKIKRVMGKKLRGAPHEVMLVIDATTGQNGISQARLFDAAVDVTGLTLTKLDGTSKGGIVANICRDMKIPIRFIGIGEQMDDLRDFDAAEFVDALFQSDK